MLLSGMVLFVPPFHWIIVALFILLSATLGAVLVTILISKYSRFTQKKRTIGVIVAAVLALIFILQALHVLTPLNILMVLLLGASLLAL